MDLIGQPIGEQLRALGQRGILTTPGILDKIRCSMEECLGPGGREHFDQKQHPPGPWSPSVDHVLLKSEGGKLDPDNVRLAHVLCNRVDDSKKIGRPYDRDLATAREAAARWAEDHPQGGEVL